MFPMYGKTLSDFPTRPDAFLAALQDIGEADINSGFELAFRRLKEFPVPAQIRELAVEAALESRRRLDTDPLPQLRLAERTKDERFDNTTPEQRKAEFDEMFRKAAEKADMNKP
jgi:hypothetical protein